MFNTSLIYELNALRSYALPLFSEISKDDEEYAKRAVERFWNTPMRTGRRRYYDNCLYFFCMLALSGKYVKY